MNGHSALNESGVSRRVLLLETDERAGLVAAIADACHERGVSLEITTGLAHVLLTFEADAKTTEETVNALGEVGGVSSVHSYTVMAVPPEAAVE